jgi:hypothetical protein
VINSSDDEVAKLTIRRPGPTAGQLHLEVRPPGALRVFKGATEVLTERVVDLGSPTGQLAELVEHDVDLYIEAIAARSLVTIEITLMDDAGVVVDTDKVDLMADFDLLLRRNITNGARVLSQLPSAKFSFVSTDVSEVELLASVDGSSYWSEVITYNNVLDVYQQGIAYNGPDAAGAVDEVYSGVAAFGTECYGAIVLVLYKAVLDTFEESEAVAGTGRSAFNSMFGSIVIHAAESTLPPLATSDPFGDGWELWLDDQYGDWRYFKNPHYHPRTSWWQGENAVQLSDEDNTDAAPFYGHPVGVLGKKAIIDLLNENRKEDATEIADLTDKARRLASAILLMDCDPPPCPLGD